MIFNISDDLPGEKRKQLLRILPIIYALDLFDGNKRDVAKFLGVSINALKSFASRDEYLKYFINKDGTDGKTDASKKLCDIHLMKAKKTSTYYSSTPKERAQIEKNIRNLYFGVGIY